MPAPLNPHYGDAISHGAYFAAGVSIHPCFINEAEESYLLAEISKAVFHTFRFQVFEARRRVASFGHDWNFDKRILSKGADIPAAFYAIIEKVARKLSLAKEDFAELLLTEYAAGAVINWHRDAPPFDVIAGISLLSDCTFRLRPYDKTRQGRNAVISLPVQRRSLYVMAGAARAEWQHSISAMKCLRYAITFRTIKNGRASS